MLSNIAITLRRNTGNTGYCLSEQTLQAQPQVIQFEGYKFSRLGRVVSLLVPVTTALIVLLFATLQHSGFL